MARELGLSRTTVGQYMEQAAPVRKAEAQPRPRPVWTKVAERVETLLAESAQWTGGKQRLTVTRLHGLLVADGHAVGLTSVKAAVAEWKRQRREVFIPLTYLCLPRTGSGVALIRNRLAELAETAPPDGHHGGTRRNGQPPPKAWIFIMTARCSRI